MHKISRFSLAFASALLSATLLGACGDDNATTPFSNTSATSSSSEQPIDLGQSSSSEVTTTSSDSQQSQQSSSSENAPEQSSSSETLLPPPLSSSSATPSDPNCVETPVATVSVDSVGLADIGDAFKSVRCNEKAVFIIRHAERDMNDDSKSAPITYWENEPDSVGGQPSDGVRQARAVGKKLISPEEFVFTHTPYLRTEQTCQNIAIGRGQQSFQHDTVSIYTISWFKKDKDLFKAYEDSSGNFRTLVSAWAYDKQYADAFYDLQEKSIEIVQNDFAPSYASMKNKYRMVCTHDDFVLPFTVFASNGTVNYRFHDPASRNWPNFLTGVAIIIDDKNQIRYIPFKGLGRGIE